MLKFVCSYFVYWRIFFREWKNPQKSCLFVWAGWLAKLIQRKHAQQCCISTSFSPSTRTSSSLFVLNLIILWWLTAFLQHIRLHSRHSVLCGSKSLTYWQDRRPQTKWTPTWVNEDGGQGILSLVWVCFGALLFGINIWYIMYCPCT